MTNEGQFTRQLGIIDPEKLSFSISLIGAGSIGSWTALALLKLGCSNLTVYDQDEVEDHNPGSQIYTSTDVGESKLKALQDKLLSLTETEISIKETAITEDNVSELFEHDIIISAVDNIETRKLIFEALKTNTWQGNFIDGRMAGNVIEVYTTPMSEALRVAHYETRLFTPEEGEQVDCSMRSVVYNVFIVAGFITDLVARVANEQRTPRELIIDLANFTIMGGLI